MSHTRCTFIKPDNELCAARSLPDSDFCLFHDPAHQEALAAGRSKGGPAPRRRFRRFPRLLDHLHVAELLGELFIEALNDPEPIDTKRLQALTRLAQVILKTVGIPKDAEPLQNDRREPTAAEDCLLRLYRSLAPEVETLLAAEAASTVTPPEAPRDPGHADDRQPLETGPALRGPARPAAAASISTPQPPNAPPPQPINPSTPELLNARTPERLNSEQDGNRSRTGLPGTRTAPIRLFAVRPSEPGVPPGLPLANPLEDLSLHAPYPLSFCLPIVDCSHHPADAQAAQHAPRPGRPARHGRGSRPSGSTR